MKTPNNPLFKTTDQNDFGEPETDTVIKKVWSYPLGKTVILAGGTVAILFAAGGLFRLLAWVRNGYNDFKDSGSGPLSK